MKLLFAMAPSGGDGGSMVSTLIMFGAIFAIFLFYDNQTSAEKAKERDALLSSIKKVIK